MKRSKAFAVWMLVLAVAAAVRLPSLPAGLPYMNYVDEGHVFHHVVHLLAHRTWEPDVYSYPSFPFYVIALATLVWSPVYAAVHGRSLVEDLPPSPPHYYDIVLPVDLIVLGRLVTLAFSLGLVLLTGLYARRLAGPAAGLFAAWLAALLPALVIRGVVANINPMVAFFALAALFFAEGAREGERPWRSAALAGVMTGLTAVSKYPSALVCLPVALAILLGRRPWSERLRLLFLAGGTAALAAVLAMPALLLRTREVVEEMRGQAHVYVHQAVGSYWEQAVHRAEWDQPLNYPEVGMTFLVLTAAGLGVALWDRRWRKSVLGWVVFAAATAVLLVPYQFRAFRNLLPLVPLACLLIALLYARLREALPLQGRRAVDLAAVLLPVVLFTPALHQYGRHQLAVEDTREKAVRWLAAHAGPKQRVLFAEELAFLPPRIASLPGEAVVHDWERARTRILRQRFQYVVLGGLLDRQGRERFHPRLVHQILRGYEVVAEFGSSPTMDIPGAFRGNDQLIYILRRKPKEKKVQTGFSKRKQPPPARGSARKSSAPSTAPAPSEAPRAARP
jgi:hypothetical protein